MRPTPAGRRDSCECNWLAKIWNAIHRKQDKLTPGAGISIDEHNVISSTGASPEWGSITGTLSDQQDLQDALDGKEDTGTAYTKGETDALLNSKADIYDTYTKDETDVLLSYKADVSSVEAIEDELGSVGQAGTIRNDIALVNDRVDSVEDEIGPETTTGTLRYKIKENTNDIISIENEIDIIDGIIAAHSTAINDKADKTYVDAHISDTNNPHSVTKAQVGLANVDNTSDANKPISTATQNAINAINDKFEITNTFVAMSSIISGCEGSMYITQILPKVYIVSLIDIRRSTGFSATTVYTFPSPNRNTPRAVLGDDNGNHGLAYMGYNSPDLIVRYSGGNTYASEQMVVILQ